MKWVLRVFSFLDLLSLLLTFDQAKIQFQSFLTNETLTSIQFFSRILFLLTWLSLIFSAILLTIPKKAGIIVYYCQIPFRIIFYIFSLGFISLLSYVIDWPYLQNVFMPVIIFTEMLRAYLSYRMQKKLY